MLIQSDTCTCSTFQGRVFPAEGTISDCFNYARMYIDNVSTHSWTDPRGSGQYLNDGTGTIQGFICSK